MKLPSNVKKVLQKLSENDQKQHQDTIDTIGTYFKEQKVMKPSDRVNEIYNKIKDEFFTVNGHDENDAFYAISLFGNATLRYLDEEFQKNQGILDSNEKTKDTQ